MIETTENCGHDEREQRPICTTDGEITAMCPLCYVTARRSGRMDMERDKEVFGY